VLGRLLEQVVLDSSIAYRALYLFPRPVSMGECDMTRVILEGECVYAVELAVVNTAITVNNVSPNRKSQTSK
jgi:hypothetical protein